MHAGKGEQRTSPPAPVSGAIAHRCMPASPGLASSRTRECEHTGGSSTETHALVPWRLGRAKHKPTTSETYRVIATAVKLWARIPVSNAASVPASVVSSCAVSPKRDVVAVLAPRCSSIRTTLACERRAAKNRGVSAYWHVHTQRVSAMPSMHRQQHTHSHTATATATATATQRHTQPCIAATPT